MGEETERHETEREVEREIGVEKPDGTEINIDTERETEHEHGKHSETEEEDDGRDDSTAEGSTEDEAGS